METSLRLRGADSTYGQHLGLRSHAKQKVPLAYNTLLQLAILPPHVFYFY